MRLLNFLLAVAFLVIASLQVNAPEPVAWILIFGSMAVVCILALFNYFPRVILFTLLGVFGSYSLYLGWRYGVSTGLRINGFAGIVVCVIILVFYLVRSYRIR
ncbi:MAG: hypothetical protein HRU69_11520 [Flammeovirgaceae bacterium]|nr:MAG: hypothetical protein HRU69_11520 [Flammeovirgaceae bacterium]